VTGQAREALPLFEHAATVAKTLGDFALLTSSTLYIGSARFILGDLAAAEESFRRVIEALDEAAAGEKLGLHGLPLVFAESGLTALLTEQGRFEEARASGTRSVRIAEALKHPYMLVFALRTLAFAYTVEGRTADAVTMLERGRALCEEAGLLALAPNILASLGHVYSLTARSREGIRLIEQALDALDAYGHRVWYVVVLTQLAEAWLLDGDVVRAHDCASRALAAARERGERGFEAAALRVLGAVATRGASPDLAAAREHYRGALLLAEARAMQPLIAHCHAGLATIHTLLGDHAAAGEHRATALAICQTIGMQAPPELAQREVSSASVR
jgi:tetratricopeptide (TPR) repeat protein